MKKYSFLSLLLVGASGTIAAFIPAKKADANSAKLFANGFLQNTTGTLGELRTCVPLPPNQAVNCDYTATGAGALSGTTDGVAGGVTSATSPLTAGGSPNPTYTAGGTTGA